MATYRERREARAERLRGWADKREARADAGFDRAHQMGDAIPFGQPILAGHHSQGRDTRYRARMASTMDHAVEDARKADSMRSKADNIEAAADRAIYRDDVDAVDRLREKLAALEAERDGAKAYNATARKGAPDPSLLSPYMRDGLATAWKYEASYMERRKGQLPPYHLSNLSGLIATTRKRLAELEGGE